MADTVPESFGTRSHWVSIQIPTASDWQLIRAGGMARDLFQSLALLSHLEPPD